MFCQIDKVMTVEERILQIGQAVKAARDRAGLSQDEVAERLGLHGKGRASTVSRWESGTRGLPVEQVAPLAEILGCSVASIVGGSEPGQRGEVTPREALQVIARLVERDEQSRPAATRGDRARELPAAAAAAAGAIQNPDSFLGDILFDGDAGDELDDDGDGGAPEAPAKPGQSA